MVQVVRTGVSICVVMLLAGHAMGATLNVPAGGDLQAGDRRRTPRRHHPAAGGRDVQRPVQAAR